MEYCGVFALASILLINVATQAQSNEEVLLRGMTMLDDGSNKRNFNQILEARGILEQIPDNDSLVIWAHYYIGAASSSLANMIAEKVAEGGRRDIADHVNHAITNLEAAVEIDPTFADGWVLLSTAYAHKISVRPLKVIGLSRKFHRAMDKAFELEPNNPRVILLGGIMDYFLPSIAGGDKERAEQRLNKAALLLAEENITHPFRPSWGHDEAHARLGIVYMDRGDLEDARKAFERALEINPEYGWVMHELIPALEKLESEAPGK